MKRYFLYSLILISSLQGDIYDCFLFFNEKEILKIHLDELYDFVDHFVIVESTQRFSGAEKTLYFPKIEHELSKYSDKIIYIPVHEVIGGDNPWIREGFQRNQIMRGLKNCTDEDIVIIGDVDEIIKPSALKELFTPISQKEYPFIGCECAFYRWFLNRKDPAKWVGPLVTRFEKLKEFKPNQLRGARTIHTFPNSGWHFSNMGGLSIFLDKIRSFSHYKECNADLIAQDPEHLYSSIRGFEKVEIDDSYPVIIQENYDYYSESGFIDPT